MNKLKSTLAALLVIGFAAPTLFAQSESTAIFLLFPPHARVSGMGEAYVGLADDVSAAYINPGGLAFQQGWQAATTYSPILPNFNIDDLYYLFGVYRNSVEGLGTMAFSVLYSSYGKQLQTGEDSPDVIGEFSSNEFALTGSFSTLFSENTGVGLNVKFIRSNLSPVGAGTEVSSGQSGQAAAFAVGIGVLQKEVFFDQLDFGLSVTNIGPKMTYIDKRQADPLPTNFRAGFAYTLVEEEFNKFTILADMNKQLVNRQDSTGVDPVYKAAFTSWKNNDYIYSFGAEYWYANLLALRMGYYNDGRGRVKYLSFGVGLKLELLQFDFGYISTADDHPLANTMRFSFTFGG